ncbi:hypothetical protein FA15DRAFT_655737 [Coprinopsis marcescibilis]|uniref:Uncharacterized protein n=1 Tax=Coprinopsis marcescibilis TaxID=230819 RepID=A0A5C3KW52_COPMA|nr:hypothetical protein FA15DRAFT_655737 [Coprinopsis marcescibilis]
MYIPLVEHFTEPVTVKAQEDSLNLSKPYSLENQCINELVDIGTPTCILQSHLLGNERRATGLVTRALGRLRATHESIFQGPTYCNFGLGNTGDTAFISASSRTIALRETCGGMVQANVWEAGLANHVAGYDENNSASADNLEVPSQLQRVYGVKYFAPHDTSQGLLSSTSLPDAFLVGMPHKTMTIAEL